MNKVSKLVLSIFIVSLIMIGFAPMTLASGSATISLTSSKTTVATDTTFTVDVIINPNGESLDTARAVITFPAAYLEATNFTFKTLFSAKSPGNKIDNAAGIISQGGYNLGSAVTKSGVFGTITFKAKYATNAVISVGSSSRLISIGEEKINLANLGKVTVKTTGKALPATTTTPTAGVTLTAEQIAIGVFGKIYGALPSTATDWTFVKYAAYGYTPATKDMNAEKYAVDKFISVYKKLPSTSSDWNVVAALAYSGKETIPGEKAVVTPTPAPTPEPTPTPAPTPVATTLTAEQIAIGVFGKIYGKLPSTATDWTFVKYAAYGYTPATKDMNAEKYAVDKFISIYKKLPSTSADWNIVAAIAYSGKETIPGAKAVVTPTPEPTPTPTPAPTPAAATLTAEQIAIGVFGKIYGKLPSTATDWTFVKYAAYGYTPATK
ncbi:MAG: hypothetical protein PHT51_03090, partial [Patescibacteria group bacterium]|nr:hypothetical protein [Patescibacteria group bacterium]